MATDMDTKTLLELMSLIDPAFEALENGDIVQAHRYLSNAHSTLKDLIAERDDFEGPLWTWKSQGLYRT